MLVGWFGHPLLILKSSTEGGFLISGICSAKTSCVLTFCTNSSTFLMSVDLKIYILLFLKWPNCCLLLLSADTATSVQGHRPAHVL